MRRAIVVAFCAALLSAIAAPASGAAEPAFYECVKVKGGKYQAGCTEEGGKGGFEAVEGIGKPTALKASLTELEASIPRQAARGELACKKIKFAGSLGSPTSMRGITITGTGCKERTREFTCTTPGEPAGTVMSGPLGGTLGYIDAAEHRVGIDFTREGAGPILEYACSGLVWEAGGSWIGEIGPVGHVGKVFTMSFQADPEGFQSIKSFEGGPEDVPIWHLSGTGPFNGALTTTITYKGPKLLLKG